MTDRLQVEQLVRALHAARVEGNLERLCGLYSEEARLRIAGTTDGKPIAIAANGIVEIRPLAVDSGQDDQAQPVHDPIHSKITGAMASTELVDLLEVRDGQIASYIEFFVPC
jgi:ketosteroid isomerase-like protein